MKNKKLYFILGAVVLIPFIFSQNSGKNYEGRLEFSNFVAQEPTPTIDQNLSATEIWPSPEESQPTLLPFDMSMIAPDIKLLEPSTNATFEDADYEAARHGEMKSINFRWLPVNMPAGTNYYPLASCKLEIGERYDSDPIQTGVLNEHNLTTYFGAFLKPGITRCNWKVRGVTPDGDWVESTVRSFTVIDTDPYY